MSTGANTDPERAADGLSSLGLAGCDYWGVRAGTGTLAEGAKVGIWRGFISFLLDLCASARRVSILHLQSTAPDAALSPGQDERVKPDALFRVQIDSKPVLLSRP